MVFQCREVLALVVVGNEALMKNAIIVKLKMKNFLFSDLGPFANCE